MKNVYNLAEAQELGFTAELNKEGSCCLMYDDLVVHDDPSNPDLYDLGFAESHLVAYANGLINEINRYAGSIADLGAGPEQVEEDEAICIVQLVKGWDLHAIHKTDAQYERICQQLGIGLNDYKRVYWIGANMDACLALAEDKN